MTKRKKILFIVSRLPINTQTGDRVRVYHFIRELAERGHQVDVMGFVPLGKYNIRTDIEDITHQCIGIEKEGIEFENPRRSEQLKLFFSSFFKGYPFRVWQWYDEKFIKQACELIAYHNYDVIHFSEIVMGIIPHEQKMNFGNAHTVFDLIDSVAFSLKNSLSQELSLLWPFRFIEQQRLKKFEKQIVNTVDQAILISERDKNFLELNNIKIIPNGIEENNLNERTRDIDLLFTGNMAAEANIDAVHWFAQDIMPNLLIENPDLRFTVAGANPPEEIRKLESDNITITGFVQDINEYYRRAKLFVCPMRLGAGQKNKILEAMINRTTVISTAEANIGIDAPTDAIAIADNEKEFCDTIIALLREEQHRQALAENGYKFAKDTFSWDRSVDLLEQCYAG